MLDRLYSLLADIYLSLAFWYVIPFYQGGILVRLGLFKRSLSPGLHWKIPGIDEVLTTDNQVDTLELRPQSLTTADGKTIVVSGIVKYQICDTTAFLLLLGNKNSVLQDVSVGAIKDIITNKSWSCIQEFNIERDICQQIRAEVNKYGFKIYKVTLANLAEVTTYRLIGNLPSGGVE
mgnify:FL=1